MRNAREVSPGTSMRERSKHRLCALPGVLQGVLDDHGGVVGGRQRVSAEGIAPRGSPRAQTCPSRSG